MAMAGLAALTPEQRAEMAVKARTAKAAKVERRRASTLRRDFLDAPRWERLASTGKVRLPPWGEPVTTTVMRQFLNRVGVSGADYLDYSGERQLSDFAKANPEWPARAWAGIVLEWQAGQHPERWESAEQPELELV